MPTINVPHGTFQRLTEMAAALNVTVDELVLPALESLAQIGVVEAQAPTLPLTGEAWLREL